MKLIQCILFIVILCGTMGIYAQSNSTAVTNLQFRQESQETFNALLNERLNQLSIISSVNSDSVNRMSQDIQSLRSSLDRITGIGIGLGATLTILQAFMVILTFRNGGGRPSGGD